jgi:hypothetical protein
MLRLSAALFQRDLRLLVTVAGREAENKGKTNALRMRHISPRLDGEQPQSQFPGSTA